MDDILALNIMNDILAYNHGSYFSTQNNLAQNGSTELITNYM